MSEWSLDRIEELVTALGMYGRHTDECNYYFNPHSPDAFQACTCGWDEIWEKYIYDDR